jgi:CheY-like chemotaxis protein
MVPSILPRVLYVDDDEDSREMLITLLRHELIEAKAVGDCGPGYFVDSNRTLRPVLAGLATT